MTTEKLVQAVNEFKNASKNLKDIISEIEGNEDLKKQVSMFCMSDLEESFLNSATNSLAEKVSQSVKQTN